MALRTNSKVVKDRIKDYIVRCIESVEDVPELKSFPEMAHFVMADFDKWCSGRRPTYNMQDYFEEYCKECPWTNVGDFYLRTYENAIDILGEILEETEDEQNKYSMEQAEHLLMALIFRELRKGVQDYNKACE